LKAIFGFIPVDVFAQGVPYASHCFIVLAVEGKGNLTQNGTADGMSFFGWKLGVHLLRYIPLAPMKKGPLRKIRSLYSFSSKRKTKKPLPQNA